MSKCTVQGITYIHVAVQPPPPPAAEVPHLSEPKLCTHAVTPHLPAQALATAVLLSVSVWTILGTSSKGNQPVFILL